MALAVVHPGTSSGAVMDVMASSLTRCASSTCSLRVCSASSSVGISSKVGEPGSFHRAGIGASCERFRAQPLGLVHPLKISFRDRYGSSTRRRKARIAFVASSVEEGVKDSGPGETSTSSSDAPNTDVPSSVTSGVKSPFKIGGKISSVAAKQSTIDSKLPGSAKDSNVALKKPALSIGSKQPSPVGQLSPKAAEQLKVSKPASVFTQAAGAAKPASPFTTGAAGTAQKPGAPSAASGAKPASPFVQPTRGKRVVDAFKEGEKEGKTTKFGQPVVPTNIFQDQRRTPEEIAADAFKFSISPGQLLLIGSFLLIGGLMIGTAFLVWKVGAIHYNEY
ncbi:hypothetical protein R1sor_016833 [Riccia sorocarpa]|uniref:Uncharacterized protein n=1 Tax=Riccia sorocarpa TaxID=122646 RepID=A0ABD3HJG4_9MARC